MKRKICSTQSNELDVSKRNIVVKEIPVKALSPYLNKWTIKARVTKKNTIINYTNAKGAGKLFSFDVLDSDGGEMHVTCFNELVDKFYDGVETGKVYMISNGTMKPASKSFNHLNNDYEMYLERYSTVQLCLESDDCIPTYKFKFQPISQIVTMQPNSFVDIIGVVSTINVATTITKKDGSQTQKRTLQLRDMSGFSVQLTLWGKICNEEGDKIHDMLESEVNPVVCIKAAKVSDFNGRSVGSLPSSQLFVGEDIPEVRELKTWFTTTGTTALTKLISVGLSSMFSKERHLISQIKDDQLWTSDKTNFITVSAIISNVKTENFAYPSCPLMIGDRQCSKKVKMIKDCQWHCHSCDKSFPECIFRYILRLQLQDSTGTTYVTAFQEAGEEIMDISAEDLYSLKEENDEKFMDTISGVIYNHYIFNLRVKIETYNDEARVQAIVVKSEKLNYSEESKLLLDSIAKISSETTSTP